MFISPALYSILPLLLTSAVTSQPLRLNSRQNKVQRIQPTSQDDLCITIMGGLPIEGVAVQVAKCFEASDSNSSLQRFILTDTNEHDYSKIKPEISSDDELCLDRGDDSSEDGSGIQLQQCQEDSESQLWKIQNHKISSDFGELQKCLDIEEDSGPYQVPDEPYPSEKFLQTWTCFEGNENQMWKLVQI